MDPLRVPTPGRFKQRKQGHHGIKGAMQGKENGSKSLESDKYKNWQRMKDQNILSASKKCGRRKRKRSGQKDRESDDGDMFGRLDI